MKSAFTLPTEAHMKQGDITKVLKQGVSDLRIFLLIKNMTTNSYYKVPENPMTSI